MNTKIKQYLEKFITTEKTYKSKDILCEIDDRLVIPFSETIPIEHAFSDVIKFAKKTEKEIGVNPLCKSLGIVKLVSKKNEFRETPILLKEVDARIENNHYHFYEVGDYFLNPYLRFALNIETSELISTLDDFKNHPSVKALEINEDISFIGNFHPYRFEIYRDLSEIIKIDDISSDLRKILMIDHDDAKLFFDWQSGTILPMDFDQKKSLENLKSNSILVHGPPGTGKSQLIGNAIGNALSINLSILMSSEKKASLDAVYKRLMNVGLHRFCLINYSKNENKLILRDLKQTWDYLSKDKLFRDFRLENTSPFQHLICELISKPKIEEWSLKYLVAKLEKLNYIFIPNDIDFNEFDQIKNIFDLIDESIFHLSNSLNFNQSWDDEKLDKIISECKFSIEEISPYYPIRGLDDVNQLIRNLLIIQGFSSDIYQKYGEIICNKSKKLIRLHADHLKIEKNTLKWEGRVNHWIKTPSPNELVLLKELAIKSSLKSRIQFHFTWKKWVRSTKLEPISTCNEMDKYLGFIEEKNKFSITLKEFGIQSIQDLKLIHETIVNHSNENWLWYKELNVELKKNYKNVHSKISNLKMILTSYFNFKNDDNIIDLFKQIHSHKKSILKDLNIIETIPNSIRNLIQKSSSLEEFQYQIHFSIWKQRLGNLEIPTRAIQKEWIQSALRYEKMKLQKSKSNASDIIRNIKEQFDYYHKIIETPKRKLTADEQQLKAELKNGKNILVKEFGKVRQHIGLRQLYESDAKKWVLALKPILMMHPHRIATYFPADPGLFDLGIIDEASQMPFSNAIGTLQRVKRVLIAGDENQMDPYHFFSSNDKEHSVFHQAKYHLYNAELTHHYRSESEELISFSNRFFYENKLRFIESANSDSNKSVIHHYVKNGNYHDGINENEAQDVCDFMISRIQKMNTDLTLGIVAFSEAQLKTIIKKIPSQLLSIVDELQESNRLFFKTLDQVQGDECDILIISFGYGRNREGNFEMRFGPINQTSGEKRLNVLFSRAKKEINFFSSVKYADFSESKNEAVNLLKQWFALLEESNLKRSKSYEIHILDILEESKNVDDFTHLIYLYHERGWRILTS